MNKSPYLHSALAFGYIFFIALVMNWGTSRLPKGPESFMIPVAILSLFTLSAAVMAYLFFYQPAVLYLDGKKKAAIEFFVKTLGSFAAIALIIVSLVFSGIIR